MIAKVSKRLDSRISGSLALLPILYFMAAYIWGLWPLMLPAPATCSRDATNYQVFVDPTGSNQDMQNWSGQAHLFTQTLESCSKVSFWTITANSSGEAAFAEPLIFPLLDRNAASGPFIWITREIQEKRAETEKRLLKMMAQKGATATDAIGIFNKLMPDTARRNVLVIFSDGQESAGKVNLENGHTCVSSQNVSKIIDVALDGRTKMSSDIEQFEAIDWVIPTNSGIRGCNSRDELQLFWESLLARISPKKTPPLRFDTNISWRGTNH